MPDTTHKNLAEALAAFQAEMPTVPKSKTAKVKMKSGGEYSYKYADLADVSAAAMPLLSKHGLSFSSLPRSTEHGYELAGTLMHTSGEEKEGALPLSGQTAQEIGSSLTYMRRYLLGCLTGVVTDDDDDGRAASQTRQRTRATPQTNGKPQLAQGIVDELVAAKQAIDKPEEWVRQQLVAVGVESVPDGPLTLATIKALTEEQAMRLFDRFENAAGEPTE